MSIYLACSKQFSVHSKYSQFGLMKQCICDTFSLHCTLYKTVFLSCSESRQVCGLDCFLFVAMHLSTIGTKTDTHQITLAILMVWWGCSVVLIIWKLLQSCNYDDVITSPLPVDKLQDWNSLDHRLFWQLDKEYTDDSYLKWGNSTGPNSIDPSVVHTQIVHIYLLLNFRSHLLATRSPVLKVKTTTRTWPLSLVL